MGRFFPGKAQGSSCNANSSPSPPFPGLPGTFRETGFTEIDAVARHSIALPSRLLRVHACPLLQGGAAFLGQPFTVSESAQKQPAPEAPAGLVPSAGAARMAETLLLLTHDDSLIEALSGV